MSSSSTKEKLLEAAGKLFSRQGYDATSVREICLEAGVNIASVNYHFGDKRSLYRAVVGHGAAESPSLAPPPREGTPEERLHALVTRTLEDIFETREDTQVIVREFLDPPEDILELLKGPMRVQYLGVFEVLEALSGGRLNDRDLHMTTLGLLAQLQYFRVSHKFIPYIIGRELTDHLTVPVLADHITRSTIRSLKHF